MKLGLNGATIMQSPIDQDIEIAAECGYQALEFWAAKLDAFVTDKPVSRLTNRISECGLTPACINSIEDITGRDAAGRAALMKELRRRVAMARELQATSIVVVPGRRDEPIAHADAVADAVDVLRAMSDVSGDIALAFEFLGKPGCTVPAVGMATEIVERVNRPNVGLVIDVFHFHAGSSEFSDLQNVPIERLLMVHLNGAEDLPKAQLTDAHRLYPGEGVIPSVKILRALRQRGYDGIASVEIFRPEYWAQDARAVAQTAFSRASHVLAAAGYAL